MVEKKNIFKENSFEKLYGRTVIEYEITANSDLHIGGGSIPAPAEVDMPVLKDSAGYPIVPGSSIKGVLRSDMERALLAYFGDEEKMNVVVTLLFGSPPEKVRDYPLASAVKFRDSKAASRKTLIRDGVRIDRNTRKAAKGAKYDIEVVPRGAKFSGTIIIENPNLNLAGVPYENARFGALSWIMDFFNKTNNSLGGATSRGFGEIKIELKSQRLYRPEDYLNGTDDSNLDESVQKEAVNSWKRFLADMRETVLDKGQEENP